MEAPIDPRARTVDMDSTQVSTDVADLQGGQLAHPQPQVAEEPDDIPISAAEHGGQCFDLFRSEEDGLAFGYGREADLGQRRHRNQPCPDGVVNEMQVDP